ncbi:hypothetical protein HDU92_004302 [Lobulomyces angularis]|nr:hypothetical protein HDU92_004302 [Lobulomyces angularis]
MIAKVAKLIFLIGLAASQIDTLSLPQNSPNVTARSEKLAVLKGQIANGPRLHVIANDPTKVFQFSNGPVVNAFVGAMIQTEVADINSRSTKDTQNFIAGIILQGSASISTLDDLSNLFNTFSSKIRFPPSLVNWQLDSSFASDQLTWCGVGLQLSTNNEFALDDNLVRSITGLSMKTLLSRKKLFRVDYSNIKKYSKINVGQFTPGAIGLFYESSTEDFLPLAIKVIDNAIVYTPKDQADHWMFAKLAFGAAESNFLPTEHFITNHIAIEPIRVELMRHVSVEHPVSALLNHHFTNIFGVSAIGQKVLIQNGTTFDTIFGIGAKGGAQFMHDKSLNYNFQKQKIVQNFADLGVSRNPRNYKYRDDLLSIHSAVGKFVKTHIDNYYKSNKEIVNDAEIQAWAAATADPNQGGVKGFDAAFKTKDALIDTVANLITIVTAQHNILNGASTWDGQIFPAKPNALYGAVPKSKDEVINARSFLAPSKQLIAGEIALHSAFLVAVPESHLLGKSYASVDLGKFSAPAIASFQKDLNNISKFIQARESKSTRPFTVLDPVQLPFNVWI